MDLVLRQPLAFRRRQLGPELLKLRTQLKLSQHEVRRRARVDPSTLTRIENGQSTPQYRTLTALLDCYNVDDERDRKRLLALIEPVDAPEWLHIYDVDLDDVERATGRPDATADLVVIEFNAEQIRAYESLYLPGLLQTREYAAAVLRGAFPAIAADRIIRLVELRMRRQEPLSTATPPRLEVVLDEAAVRRVVGGPAVMRAQLERLLALPEHVDLRVIPFGAGAHEGMSGSFSVMSFRDDGLSDVVFIESTAGDKLAEDKASVDRYSGMLDSLLSVTLSREETVALIGEVADGLNR